MLACWTGAADQRKMRCAGACMFHHLRRHQESGTLNTSIASKTASNTRHASIMVANAHTHAHVLPFTLLTRRSPQGRSGPVIR